MSEMTSTTIEALAKALSAAQAELTNPKKTHTAHVVSARTGGKFAYHYADLAEIIEHVRPVLAKHKLAFTQLVQASAAETWLETRLIHESGQWIGAEYPLPKLADSQAMGSAITYARRYSLCAILGIAAEDDEDGGQATEAQAAADDAKRTEATAKLEALKKAASEGRVRSAHDGRQLAPGEDPRPVESQTAVADLLAGIDSRLAEAMRKSGISPEQLKAFYVTKGHMPESVEPTALPADYVGVLTKPENWKKAVAAIKEAK